MSEGEKRTRLEKRNERRALFVVNEPTTISDVISFEREFSELENERIVAESLNGLHRRSF